VAGVVRTSSRARKCWNGVGMSVASRPLACVKRFRPLTSFGVRLWRALMRREARRSRRKLTWTTLPTSEAALASLRARGPERPDLLAGRCGLLVVLLSVLLSMLSDCVNHCRRRAAEGDRFSDYGVLQGSNAPGSLIYKKSSGLAC
jgi:hypothetical protein